MGELLDKEARDKLRQRERERERWERDFNETFRLLRTTINGLRLAIEKTQAKVQENEATIARQKREIEAHKTVILELATIAHVNTRRLFIDDEPDEGQK